MLFDVPLRGHGLTFSNLLRHTPELLATQLLGGSESDALTDCPSAVPSAAATSLTGLGWSLPSCLHTNRIRALYAVDYDCFGYHPGLTEAGLGPAEAPKVQDFRYNWRNTYWSKEWDFRSVEDIENHCDTCAAVAPKVEKK